MKSFEEIQMNLQMYAEGEEGQEVAEPDIEGAEEPETGEQGEPDVDSGNDDRDLQRDAEFAAARRRAEQQYNQQIASRDAEYARRFGHLTNPETGAPIRSEQDYFAALDAQERIRQREQLRQGGIDPDLIERAVANSPVMLQAQQVLNQARMDEGNRMLNDQVQQISSFYPDVKSLEDIAQMPTFPVFDQYVRNGLSLVDAFKLANYDTLSNRGTAAAKQAAINSAKGKGHLAPIGGGAGTPVNQVDIPAAELELWKDAYPNLSYKELRTKYNNTL
jgi:hypothetical protein